MIGIFLSEAVLEYSKQYEICTPQRTVDFDFWCMYYNAQGKTRKERKRENTNFKVYRPISGLFINYNLLLVAASFAYILTTVLWFMSFPQNDY